MRTKDQIIEEIEMLQEKMDGLEYELMQVEGNVICQRCGKDLKVKGENTHILGVNWSDLEWDPVYDENGEKITHMCFKCLLHIMKVKGFTV